MVVVRQQLNEPVFNLQDLYVYRLCAYINDANISW